MTVARAVPGVTVGQFELRGNNRSTIFRVAVLGGMLIIISSLSVIKSKFLHSNSGFNCNKTGLIPTFSRLVIFEILVVEPNTLLPFITKNSPKGNPSQPQPIMLIFIRI